MHQQFGLNLQIRIWYNFSVPLLNSNTSTLNPTASGLQGGSLGPSTNPLALGLVSEDFIMHPPSSWDAYTDRQLTPNFEL